jgi:probable F420-dependent oxidoreductase
MKGGMMPSEAAATAGCGASNMKLGFALPVSGSWATPENIDHVAHRAEELDYHSLWTFQRLLSPVDHSWGETHRSVHDSLVSLAYSAATTRRIRLAVAVVNFPFVTPVLLAKQSTTLDILSGGRLDLGLGLGWADEEYAASGTSKERAGRRLEEFVAALKTLWTSEVVEFQGEFYHVPRMQMEPKPVQKPHPPIILGGFAVSALRRAGRMADGWVSSGRADLTMIGDSVEIVKGAAKTADRDPATVRVVCRAAVKVRKEGKGEGSGLLSGTIDEIRSDIRELEGLGFSELFVDLNFDPEIGSPETDPRESRRRADEALEAFAP